MVRDVGYRGSAIDRHLAAVAHATEPRPEPDWKNVTVEQFAVMSAEDRNKVYRTDADQYRRLRHELDGRPAPADPEDESSPEDATASRDNAR